MSDNGGHDSISFLFSSLPFLFLFFTPYTTRTRNTAGGVGLEPILNWIGATGLMAEADAIVTGRQMERTKLG